MNGSPSGKTDSTPCLRDGARGAAEYAGGLGSALGMTLRMLCRILNVGGLINLSNFAGLTALLVLGQSYLAAL